MTHQFLKKHAPSTQTKSKNVKGERDEELKEEC